MKYLLITASLGLCAPSYAFTLQGTNSNIRGWDTKKLAFRLNPTNCPSVVDSLLDDAMETWNSVPTSNLTVKRGDDTAVTLAEVVNGTSTEVPAIVCSTNMAAEAGLDPSVIPGVAMGIHTAGNGHIDYGYIVINAQEGAAANVATLDHDLVKVVLAHEMGHVIGLGHSEDTEALMYYDATKKQNLALAQDDMDGITYLYPRDELKDDQFLGGCGVIAGYPTSANLFSLLFLFVFPATVVKIHRRRRT